MSNQRRGLASPSRHLFFPHSRPPAWGLGGGSAPPRERDGTLRLMSLRAGGSRMWRAGPRARRGESRGEGDLNPRTLSRTGLATLRPTMLGDPRPGATDGRSAHKVSGVRVRDGTLEREDEEIRPRSAGTKARIEVP